MTDTRLRAVTRAVAQGETSAPARLLVERVRAGEVSTDRVRLAAWLGDAHAVAALGRGVVRPQPPELGAWLLALAEFNSPEPVVRALASVALPQVTRREHGPEMAAALRVILGWLEQPFADLTLLRSAGRLATHAARRSRRRASPLLLCAWATQLAASTADRWHGLACRRLARWSVLLKAADDPRPTIRKALLLWALDDQPSRRRSARRETVQP